MTGFPKNAPLRLKGKALQQLRVDVFDRDKGLCQECGRVTVYGMSGYPWSYDMAHIRGRGVGGEDSLSNCHVLCHQCHMRQHQGEKPCPSKK